MRHQNGAAIYGAWVLLVQVASRCPVRGVLADEDGPITADDLDAKTGCPAAVFTEAFQVLVSDGINWLTQSPGISWNLPESDGISRHLTESPGTPGDSRDRTERNGTERNGNEFNINSGGKTSGIFNQLTKDSLANTGFLVGWCQDASTRKRPVVANTESELIRVLTVAEHCLARAKNPPAMFAAIIGSNDPPKQLSAACEDRARKRLNEYRQSQQAAPASQRFGVNFNAPETAE